MNISYIILKHVIWRFQIYNLFRAIFKFHEDKSSNVFRETLKCFRETANFNFFTKQIIYLASPDHPLQSDIYVCVLSKSLKFFRTSKNGLNSDYFTKNAHKIAKSNYFPHIFDDSDSPINSLSDDI